MLLQAGEIGEAQIQLFDVVFLRVFQYVFGCFPCISHSYIILNDPERC